MSKVWISRTEGVQILLLESLNFDLKTTDFEATLFKISIEANYVLDETSLRHRQIHIVIRHGLTFIDSHENIIHVTLIRVVVARRV